MDIRNFFSPTNALKKGGNQKFTNLTEKEEAKLKESKSRPNSKKRRLVIIDSDSDEEPLPSKKVQKNSNELPQTKEDKKEKPTENCVSPPKKKLNFSALQKKKPEEKVLKAFRADDFFKSPPAKKKIAKPMEDAEYEIVDDDEDFEKTLKQLDKKSKNSCDITTENCYVNGDVSEAKKKILSNENKLTNVELIVKVDKEKLKRKDVITEDLVQKSQLVRKDNDTSKTKEEKPTKTRKVLVKSEKELGKKDNDTSKMKEEKPTKTPQKVPVKSEKERIDTNSKDKPSSQADEKISPKSSEKSPKIIKKEDINTAKTDTTPEPKRNAANYRNYMQREGPQALGSKEIPVGQDDCLQGLTFIITGILESIERDEAKNLIIKYGGKVMANISKTTKYMVVGRDAGPAKIEKAEKFGTKLLSEDELFELIKTTPGKKPTSSGKNKSTKSSSIKVKEESKPSSKTTHVELTPADKEEGLSLMWVDKYKPTSMNQVIGQQGYSSCAKKLLHWLGNWWKNNSSEKKAQKNWNAKEDGSVFKAALLSGPPGVGKTTTAQLACKELGFDYIELNASDTRSKKTLQTQISELLNNQTISASMKGERLVQKHIIIFDEVDGMSGNEDRGGTQELIALIRNSKIPVICICNDRQHPKIRSLANYCFDLRFLRPRVEQIKGAMMSLLHKEKLKLPNETLHEIIIASNQDLRQVLHYLSFLSSKDVQELKHLKPSSKDVKLGPFEVLKRVFAIDEAKATINDKASLFFHDYSLSPLFVQENYLAVKPMIAKADIHKNLDLLSQAADSISYGDTIDRCIRSNNNWSLLPTQAIFSSVIPGECMRGYMTQMILFPSWLGKNSSRNHMDRVLQQIHMHTRLQTSGNKTELALDYLQLIRQNLTEPLINYGNEKVPEVLKMMENYYLLREDLDSIVELTHWPVPDHKDPMTLIEAKTKAALTRALNKEGHKNPYATVSIKKGKKRSVDTSFDGEDGDEESEEDEDDSKPDAMVKLKKPAGGKKQDEIDGMSSKGKGRGKSSTSGRGRGRGRGKK